MSELHMDGFCLGPLCDVSIILGPAFIPIMMAFVIEGLLSVP